jgi:hypothetical protein
MTALRASSTRPNLIDPTPEHDEKETVNATSSAILQKPNGRS